MLAGLGLPKLRPFTLFRIQSKRGEWGPIPENEVRRLIAGGQIPLDARVDCGDGAFVPVMQVRPFAEAFQARFGPQVLTGRAPAPFEEATEDNEHRVKDHFEAKTEFADEDVRPTPFDEATNPLSADLAVAPAVDAVALPETLPPTAPSQASAPRAAGYFSTTASGPPADDPFSEVQPTPLLPQSLAAMSAPDAVPVPHRPEVSPSLDRIHSMPGDTVNPSWSAPGATRLPYAGPALRSDPLAVLHAGIAMGVWAIVFALLFGASHVAGLGKPTDALDPRSAMYYLRLAALSTGIPLILWVNKVHRFRWRELEAPWTWLLFAAFLGALLGIGQPPPRGLANATLAVSMTILTVFAEEVFFRGYLNRALVRGLRGAVWPTMFAAVAYGAYRLSFQDIWVGRDLSEVLLWCLAIIVGAGLPYALLYQLTRSFTVALLCHMVAAVLTVLK